MARTLQLYFWLNAFRDEGSWNLQTGIVNRAGRILQSSGPSVSGPMIPFGKHFFLLVLILDSKSNFLNSCNKSSYFSIIFVAVCVAFFQIVGSLQLQLGIVSCLSHRVTHSVRAEVKLLSNLSVRSKKRICIQFCPELLDCTF